MARLKASQWIKPLASLWRARLPGSDNKTARERQANGEKRETGMAKIDLDALSIEELAALRDNATDKLAEKVAARQAELEAELEKLSHYGKPAKKSPAAAPLAKARKADEKKNDEVREPIAKAA
jgi:hypothetical protein